MMPTPTPWVCTGCNRIFLTLTQQHDSVCIHCKDPLGTSVWKQENQYEDQPHGWIQWKGTNACMDIYCECGAQFHVDDDFLYYIQCPYCGAYYAVSGFVQLIKLTTPEQIQEVKTNPSLHILSKSEEDF